LGFWDTIKRALGIRPPARDVSGASDVDLDVVAEHVDRGGGPLRPLHRRLIQRDERLLPKAKPRRIFRRKRRKLMTRQEAGRLFAATLRTRDRHVRDLLCDEAQLRRLGLPLWSNEADVAEALGLPVGTLRAYSMHRDRERVVHYVTFAIPKRTGGERLIMAPKRRLREVLRKLDRLLVRKLPVSEHAHGFRPGRSVATHAAPHVGQAVVVRLDLRDFFPSVHVGRIRGLLVAYGYGYSVAATLATLMTEAPRQPVDVDGVLYHVPVGSRHCVQGAPTSPGLCNAVVLRLDRRLAGLARKLGFAYTRYADDLTFSGPDPATVAALLSWVGKIVREEGFELRREKTRVMRRGSAQRITGVTVNEGLGLSRRERRKIRAAIHELGASPDPGALARVRGRLAWAHMLNAKQAERLRLRMPTP